MGLFGKSKEEKLMDAADSGDLEAVRKLLDKGADVHYRSEARLAALFVQHDT
jgi:ankyrin repeat protein